MWEIISNVKEIAWNYRALSKDKHIQIETILANPQIPWDWINVLNNPNLTWKHIQDNPNEPWNYGILSSMPIITWDIITATAGNPNLKWDYVQFCDNPNLTWDIYLILHNKYPNNINIINQNCRLLEIISKNTFTFHKHTYKIQTEKYIWESKFIIQFISTIVCKYIQ